MSERDGDREATAPQEFQAFFEDNERRLYGTLCLVTGNTHDAEELTQEAFLRVWERWERVRATDDPVAYLYRIAFNLFRSTMRRALRRVQQTVLPVSKLDPFEQVDAREDLLVSLRGLPSRQRAALVLVHLLDLTSDQAAEFLRVKAVTVRALASDARRALRTEGETGDE